MSEAMNSSWPFGEMADAAGLDIEKIFGSGGNAASGDANPFDVPQAQLAPASVERIPAEEKAEETESPAANEEESRPASLQEVSPEAPAANLLEAAFTQKTVENAQKGLFEKPPVFCHKSAKEPIADPTMTFEELRIRKSEDFADLEEGKNVSWTVEYCGIVKSIKDPKGTTIISMKESIERSREFLDALKKAKDKNPDCLVKPKVTMQR